MLVGADAHAVMRIPRPSLDGAGPLGVDLHPAPRLAAGWAAAGGAKKAFRVVRPQAEEAAHLARDACQHDPCSNVGAMTR